MPSKDKRKKVIGFQWAQLAVLSYVHIAVDIFPGMAPAILPALQDYFGMSVATGAVLLSVYNISCNFWQLVTGHLRENKRKPMLIIIGVFLSSIFCITGFLGPASNTEILSMRFSLLALLVIISGFGVAIAHPEQMRAVHNLRRIRSALSSAIFISAGFVGFAVGGWAGSSLIEKLGMRSLVLLLIPALIGVIFMLLFRVKLAVEHKGQQTSVRASALRIPFWPIFFMSIFATITAALIVWLIPQSLDELGKKLSFGGISTMVFGLASSAGAMIWARLSKKISEIACVTTALFIGSPIFFAYVALMHYKWAIIILALASLTASSVFPLIVSIARYSTGPGLGQRMAIILGGSWGIASLMPLFLGVVVEKIGARGVLAASVWLYLFGAVIGIYNWRNYLKAKREIINV